MRGCLLVCISYPGLSCIIDTRHALATSHHPLNLSLQALNLQAVNMGDMQQLVLHMPGQDLASQLQFAGMPGMNMTMAQMGLHMGGVPGGPKPSRDAVVGNIKEALKLLMHASDELQVG